MIELLDKTLIRILFISLLLLSLWGYKFIYQFLATSRIFNKTQPYSLHNESSIIVLFSRILGISIIFSQINLDLEAGLLLGVLSLVTTIAYSIILYTVSLYILDSISLNYFESHSEIGKKNNLVYSLFSCAHAIGASFIIRSIGHLNTHSIIIFFTLWLFAMVLISVSMKCFRYIYKQTIESILLQESISGCLCYLSFFMGCALIISSIVETPLQTIQLYLGQVILKFLLSILIIPIFFLFFEWLFKMKKNSTASEFSLKYSLYYSLNLFSSSLLTISCVSTLSS